MFTHTICVVYIAIHDIHKEPTRRLKALNNTNRENYVERKTVIKGEQRKLCRDKNFIKGEQIELCRDKDCH